MPVSYLSTTRNITSASYFLQNRKTGHINVSNFLIWHKTNFASLTNDEIKTLKAQNVQVTDYVNGYIQ